MARTLASLLGHNRRAEHDERLPRPEHGHHEHDRHDLHGDRGEHDDHGHGGHRGRCVASGWQLRRGCTDGRGHGICPACARPVRMRSGHPLGDQAWVVETHRAA